jgi:hypothetical protein
MAVARVKLSARDEKAMEGIRADIAAGILRQVSVGYRVDLYEDKTRKGDETSTLRATKWVPQEVTMTPIGADPNSGVRSASETTFECRVIGSEASGSSSAAANQGRDASMTPEELAAKKAADDKAASDKAVADKATADAAALATRSANDAAATRATAATATLDRAAIAKEERERIENIQLDCRAAGLDDAFAADLVTRDISVAGAGRAILDEQRKKQKPSTNGHIRLGDEARDHVRAGVEEALLIRAGVVARDKATDASKRFRGMNLLRLAEECVRVANGGRDLEDMSPNAIATRALAFAASDFPKITENVAAKKLRQEYMAAAPTYKAISRENTAADFKPMSRVQTGLGSDLKEIQDNGELEYSNLAESKESYAITSYGKLMGLTRRLIINDDASAFDRIPGIMGRRAAIKENYLAWAVITGNPTMGDGVALFSTAATRLNLQASGAGSALQESSLTIARTAMRKQTDPDGTILNIEPRYLIVPAALETTAYKNVVATVTPSAVSGVSPFQGLLMVIVEPLLDANSATAWYLAGDLGMTDMLEHSYLTGGNGPSVQSFYEAKFDGILYRVIHDFGVAPIEFRGLYKSPGA